MKLLLALILALGACAGIDVPTDSPDAVPGAAIDSGVDSEAIPATAPTALGPCGQGYALAHYSNPGTWCAPTTDAGAYSGTPCTFGAPVNWAGQGIVRCPTADGGQ